MAFDDFESQIFHGINSDNVTWLPGNNAAAIGGAQLNSEVDNPYSEAGTYCRTIHRATANVPFVSSYSGGAQRLSIKQGAFDGAFDEIPNTRSVSIRSLMRGQNADFIDGASSGGINAGLIAKGERFNSDARASGGERFGGIKLALGRITNPQGGSYGNDVGDFRLRLLATSPNGASSALIGSSICDGSYADLTWYNLRMDLIPDGDAGDIVRAFTGEGPVGSEVWTQVGELYVPSEVSGYTPWGHATAFVGAYVAAATTANTVDNSTCGAQFDRLRGFVRSL